MKAITNLTPMTGMIRSSCLLTVIAAGISCSAMGQSFNQNFIRVRTPRTNITTESQLETQAATKESVETSIQYFDGLGKPIQTVQKQGSSSGMDIVQPAIYDPYGREAQKYLPYAATTSDGSYKTDAFTAGAGVLKFYNPTGTGTSGTQQAIGIGLVVNPVPFAQTGFEPSPLNRVIEQGAPGTPWQVVAGGAGHTVKIAYTTNNANSYAADPVNGNAAALYTVTINSTDQSRTLVPGGYYTAGMLYVTITKDENWVSGRFGTAEEYKDKEGRVVLKRVYNNDPTTPVLSTYYVYDDFGNLAFVLPPAANGDAAATISQPTLDNYCYQYRYDSRNRLTEKKIPGKGWEFMVYNKLDQVTFTQDANQRAAAIQVWTYIQYDALGRQVITGIWSSAGATGSAGDANISIPSRALEQWLVTWQAGQTTLWLTRDNTTTTGYAAVNPQGTVLTVSYYDNYNFTGNPYGPWDSTDLTNPTGLLTATKTTVLNPDGTYGPALWAVHYYDVRSREVQTSQQHYKGGAASYNTGNYDVFQNTYNFDNTLYLCSRFHYVAGVQTLKVANAYYYDHMSRRIQNWEAITVGSNTPTPGLLLSQVDYNEIGQVKAKHLHQNSSSVFIQDINYTYNERGWLNGINTPAAVSATQLFGEQLQYDAGTAPQYNGNISGMTWQTKVPAGYGLLQGQQGYAYTYDKLNRLMQANYTTPGSVGKFNEQVLAYDVMGNIKHLTRTNSTTAGAYLNDLTYDYTTSGAGNKLWGVTDAGTAAQGGTYLYDGNGNAITDTRNHITTIKYNLLNLPAAITRTAGNISYSYDAAGRKLEKIAGSTTRDYITGIEYNNGVIESVATEEGRATPNGALYNYEYYLKDHLGNTRAAVKQDGTITQVQDYYAFGLDMGLSYSLNPPNQYKYNGKEMQLETGAYDYGARFYDPVIARWTTIDPLADRMRLSSPYAYVYGNPVSLVDVNGKWPKWIHHRIIQEAFQGILPQSEINKLMAASDETDAPKNQTAANDRKHYMAQPGQSPADAAADAEAFIQSQQDLYLSATTDDVALAELGAGMHTLMDKTSPAHNGKNGPKPWAGNFGSNIVFGFYHFWAEANIFHLSEKRVQEAVNNLRLYYVASVVKKAIITIGPIVGVIIPNPKPNPNPQVPQSQ
jgi:RHS repeat-associated protein